MMKKASYKRLFEAEMQAKNEAYFFILRHGLLDDFIRFCRTCKSEDPHRDCIGQLLSAV